MNAAHRLSGFFFVGVFLITGGYMSARFPDAYHGDHTTRLIFHAAHTHILLAALMNGLMGLSPPPRLAGWRHRLQGAGSVLLLATPVLFTVAFFAEPTLAAYARPYSAAGVLAAFLGGLLYAAAAPRRTEPPA
jgi:hypothetical protein